VIKYYTNDTINPLDGSGRCGHKHRTPEAAVRCHMELRRYLRRPHMKGSFVRAVPLAVHEDGRLEPIEWHVGEDGRAVLGEHPAIADDRAFYGE
jgi:hypothetical protein